MLISIIVRIIKIMIIEPLPLVLKNNHTLNINVFKDTCNVCVRYCLYDRKKKRIINPIKVLKTLVSAFSRKPSFYISIYMMGKDD